MQSAMAARRAATADGCIARTGGGMTSCRGFVPVLYVQYSTVRSDPFFATGSVSSIKKWLQQLTAYL